MATTIRFTVTWPSLWVAHCHCTLCRRAHGAAYVTWFGIAEERASIEDATGNRDAPLFDIETATARVAAAVKALTSILEPVLIVVVGGMVGFIVISMYLPLFSVYDAIK